MKLFFCVLLVISMNVYAATKFKIGVLAPEGTSWANHFKNMAEEIEKATEKRVTLKIYFGGVAGDEPLVLTKIRIGQLSGGIFTGRTLGDISGDARIMEVPFTFLADRNKAFATLEKLGPFFSEGLDKAGFVNLGLFEIGQVYVVSTKKVETLDGFKGIKIWLWDGDKLVEQLVREMNLVSVPLALPDVLSSISTGIIDAAYASPAAMLAVQWDTKVKYLIDFPVAYLIGAFLLKKTEWEKISAADKAIVRNAAIKHIAFINSGTMKENEEALKLMKDSGIVFLGFPASEVAKGKIIREKIISSLTGKLFGPKAISLMEEAFKAIK
jgi:TRAP-type C4-dicarboxylate transport system substrate-binding protein